MWKLIINEPGPERHRAPLAEGALLVREFRGDKWGWKLVPAES
jgi:hypothetical protein